MARKLCVELDELKDRTDYLERILDKYNMFRMDGRASFRGATWELSEQHIAQWTAASSLPLDDADSYARFINGGLEIRGGQIDVHSSEGTERMEIDGSGIRGYAGGVLKIDINAGTGLITATGGTIGGWTLAATSLTGGNATLHNSGYLNLGTANDIVKLSAVDATYRMWVGHATAGSAPFRVTKAGVLYATGAVLSGTMQSADYVSNVSGWKIDVDGRAEFQDIIARGEIHCAVFVKDLIDARAGTMIIAKSAGVLSDDVTIPAAGTWLIYVNDPPGGAAFLFANADECHIRSETIVGIDNIWFTVSARNDMGDGRQRYTCTWTSGARNRVHNAGSPVIDYGVANQGLLRMTAESALNGPHYEILTTAGAPWTPDFVVQSRWGNLNGSYGYGATTYGVGIGSYGVAGSITVDATNGVRFFDATPTLLGQLTGTAWTIGDATLEHIAISSAPGEGVKIKVGATVRGHWSTDGSLTIGEVGANLSNVYITAGALSLRDNVTERIRLSAGGILTVKDSGGNAVITLDAALGAEITKKLTMPGASSAISIGATPPTASNAGTGIWIDRTGMYGLDTNVLQAKFDAVTGAVTAGAGTITLDVSGITFDGGTPLLLFTEGGVSTGAVYGGDSGPGTSTTILAAGTSQQAMARIYAHHAATQGVFIDATTATSSVKIWNNAIGGVVSLDVQGGFNVGTATGAGTGDIALSDDILLADGAVVGIAGNEVITWDAAGTIAFSGANVTMSGGLSVGKTIGFYGSKVINDNTTTAILRITLDGAAAPYGRYMIKFFATSSGNSDFFIDTWFVGSIWTAEVNTRIGALQDRNCPTVVVTSAADVGNRRLDVSITFNNTANETMVVEYWVEPMGIGGNAAISVTTL